MSHVSICPTVTAFGAHDYRAQIESLEPFAKRVHIDLMDGVFAPTKSPSLDQIWLPEGIVSDVHLMYQKPALAQNALIKLKPNLIIAHFEAELDYESWPTALQLAGIKAGLAVLADTPIEECLEVIKYFDHVLIFSGNLGHHGGAADLGLLNKAQKIKHAYPNVEIGWDGGISDQNAQQLIDAGINVLNVGGFIHDSPHPEQAYKQLVSFS